MTYVIGSVLAAFGLVLTFAIGYIVAYVLSIPARQELARLRNHKCPPQITAEELHKANRALWADRGTTHTVINFPSAKPGGDGA